MLFNVNKLIPIFLIFSLALTGCASKKQDGEANVETTQSSILDNPDFKPLADHDDTSEELSAKPAEGIDVDLTILSPTMVFAEVYNMLAAPDDYVGKVVKITGKYYSVNNEDDGKTYFYVLIKDATACCEQGMEFIWDDGTHTYPDEYPEEESEVTITGVFNYYKDDGLTFCYLDIDDFDEK